jgi:hypothetical protein
LKREEAISILKELLDNCTGLDGRSLELTAPSVGLSGYQIIIKGVLDEETKKAIQTISTKYELAIQTGSFWKTKHSINKTEPDTLIIYKPKKKHARCQQTLPLKNGDPAFSVQLQAFPAKRCVLFRSKN